MRKTLTILFCFLAIISSAQKQKSTTDKHFENLDTAFARVLKDWRAAGFAVAVVEKNKVVYAKGFGYRDYEKKLPVTPNTLFAIGSCTKAFTSSLIGMLQKDGKLDIDKPVRNYLPELKFYNNEMNGEITLRDMMCHRTGLPRHDYAWYLFSTNSRDTLLQRIQYMEPSAGLREKWQYNNFMFMAQGALIEKITGKSWAENIMQKIFQPLGMNNSVLTIEDMIKNNDAAVGYGVKKDSLINVIDYYRINAMSPAGSINSSVNDMANWVITWINGGKINGKEIIPAPYLMQAIAAQMVVASALPAKEIPDVNFANYGFGWFLSSYKGHYRVEHGGNIDGFSASTCFFPTDSIGIIVLCNQNNSTVPSVVRNLIADKMLNLKYFDWETYYKKTSDSAKIAAKKAEQSVVSDKKPNTKPSHELNDYTGLYNNDGYGTFEIINSHDSLFMKFPIITWWLRHYHYDVFEAFDVDKKDGIDTSEKSDTRVQFQMNEAGNINSVSLPLEPALSKPIIFNKIPKPIEATKEELQKFVGNYGTDGSIKVYIKNDKTLYLFVPGQPEYELVPTDKNKFSIKILSGYNVQFNLNDKNEVTEIVFIQPNGTFKQPKKQ
ncbi:MAG: serine hydrolase [Chitinophagaceae bacterium]